MGDSEYGFIVDSLRFSYSAVSNFRNCKYGYKLSYITPAPRRQNFFAEYGLLVHEAMEMYFGRKLDSFELSDFFKNNYSDFVKTSPPPFLKDLDRKYREQGLSFFDNFHFDRNEYEALIIEDKIDFERDGHLMVAKPDLVLKNKETGKILMVDYKSSMPWRIDKRTGKEITDKKKIDSYYHQMYIYTYALRMHRDIPVDEIVIWFPRADRQVIVPWDEEKEKEAMDWMLETIDMIQNETEFAPNTSNKFFCGSLCSVRGSCRYYERS